MTHCDVVPAERWHVDAIAANAREADRRELWAYARATPAMCLRYGFTHSAEPLTGRVNEVPVCMFGVTPRDLLTGIGVPWMVTTPGLDPLRAQKGLLALSVPWVERFNEQFPYLVNAVHAGNHKAVRWLRWLGFTIHPAQPFGPDGEDFHVFTKGF